ncbi:MAG: GtrA family protein [Novosphingobium sp.]|uniref:GtrA family protein n=1 Tax=Novosphingobium sp. TaxID=1874826 RepID=UPI0032BBBD28
MQQPPSQTLGSLLRFIGVGLCATGLYLALSIVLLNRGLNPQICNIVAFIFSTLASYLGHYFFTFKSNQSHYRTGSQFVFITFAIMGLCLLIQLIALSIGFSAKWAAVVVAVTYPPLSFIANSLLTFAKR